MSNYHANFIISLLFCNYYLLLSAAVLFKEYAVLQNVSIFVWDYSEFSTDLVQFVPFKTYYSVKLTSLILPIQKYLYFLPYLVQKNPLKLLNFDPKWEILTTQLCDSKPGFSAAQSEPSYDLKQPMTSQPGYPPHTEWQLHLLASYIVL